MMVFVYLKVLVRSLKEQTYMNIFWSTPKTLNFLNPVPITFIDNTKHGPLDFHDLKCMWILHPPMQTINPIPLMCTIFRNGILYFMMVPNLRRISRRFCPSGHCKWMLISSHTPNNDYPILYVANPS